MLVKKALILFIVLCGSQSLVNADISSYRESIIRENSPLMKVIEPALPVGEIFGSRDTVMVKTTEELYTDIAGGFNLVDQVPTCKSLCSRAYKMSRESSYETSLDVQDWLKLGYISFSAKRGLGIEDKCAGFVKVEGGNLYIVIRGTELDSLGDVATDLNAITRKLRDDLPGHAHSGFANKADSMIESLKDAILKVTNGKSVTSIVLTGHSMGAGVTTLLSLLTEEYLPQHMQRNQINVLAFNSPYTVDANLADYINKTGLGTRIFRDQGDADLVTKVFSPFTTMNHVGTLLSRPLDILSLLPSATSIITGIYSGHAINPLWWIPSGMTFLKAAHNFRADNCEFKMKSVVDTVVRGERSTKEIVSEELMITKQKINKMVKRFKDFSDSVVATCKNVQRVIRKVRHKATSIWNTVKSWF